MKKRGRKGGRKRRERGEREKRVINGREEYGWSW